MGEPQVKAGDKIISHCPLCSVGFQEPVETNVKHTCPEDGGCGRSFLVRVYD